MDLENAKEEVITKELVFDEYPVLRSLYGERGAHFKILENFFRVQLTLKGNHVFITGEPIDSELAEKTIEELYFLVKSGYNLYPSDVEYASKIILENPQAKLKDIFLDTIFVTSGRKVITPKGVTQKKYIEAIRKSEIVFGIGPAGTGKTYLAVAMAVSFLMKGEINRIILVRPAVEAGEKLGFLPGDIAEKVNPYLRPLYDALYDMLSFDKVVRLFQKGAIEIAPLAFMRGRTLNEAFIILDEAQNTTSEQMKMFLTRLGQNSKAVITGDITQIDLPDPKKSGLLEAIEILDGIPGITFVYFTKNDVVRHPIVQKIIEAYESKGKSVST
ncbi:MAG: phosphate starvation-inducible protein PhoH [Thermodesulfobacterium geofontis]|uniref:PhoH-like protein n=1 Tax=Thermodesulfobacterium geofontis TaxID=1295609 RepID=A0A2N7PQ93_9BACT|nr:MAG: phosphate starvation-inducible protein PhoH [Thermodesulfobacterium geofontis]PMP98051.1 MAG: phosphate starvation-inducible protein PhoH [Thermodesulfobacterium geofontis]